MINSTDNIAKSKDFIKPLSKILYEIIEENRQLNKIGIKDII